MQKRLRDRLSRRIAAGVTLLAALCCIGVLLVSYIIPTGARSAAYSPASTTTGATGITAGALLVRTTRGEAASITTVAGTSTTGPPGTTTTGAVATTTTEPPGTTTTGAPGTTTTGAPGTTTTLGGTGPTTTTAGPAPTTTTTSPQTTTTIPPPSGTQPAGDAAGPWNMVFDSTFDGSLPSQWSTGWFGKGITVGTSSSDQECYDPSQVREAGGVLDLTAVAQPITCGGTDHSYASGMVTTDPDTNPDGYQFTYGFMQASIWLAPTSSGLIADWPAFWADGQNWPADGEIDVLEGLGGQACAHFHDPDGAEGACAAGSFAGHWATFGADWQPGSVTYFYDGVKVFTDTSGITSAPMYLILNLAVAPGQPASLISTPASMQVAYVRVWQH
jgi:hypothetical protein